MRSIYVALLLSAASVPAGLSAQQVFHGNLHSHTEKSDGKGTPEQAYRYARNRAKIDFLLLSEHNHSAVAVISGNPSLYSDVSNPGSSVATANRMNEDGVFVAMYGQEFSTHGLGNHINVFDVPNVIPQALNGEFDDLLDFLGEPANLDRSGRVALIQFNHPWSVADDLEYGRDDFGSPSNWIRAMDEHAQLIEVINGSAFETETNEAPSHVKPTHYYAYLNLGFHLGPTANQDNHEKNWGNSTTARTGIIAPSLTRDNVIGALRSRHVFASTDQNLEVIARVNGALMGDLIPPTGMTAGQELSITLSVLDPGEPAGAGTPRYEVHVFSDDGPGGSVASVVEVFEFTADVGVRKDVSIPEVIYTGPGQYVFLEVQQFRGTVLESDADEDHLWTAPVWFEAGGAAPVPPASGPRITSLLPNSATPEGQTEEITIRNTGGAAANMQGWTVRDSAGATWNLASLGTIGANTSTTIRRGGQPMSLNNTGDTVGLVNPDGVEVQSVTYGAVGEGQVIQVP